MSLLLGIDVGTTACKAVVFDTEANIVGAGREEYRLSHPQDGWAEINPEKMWGAVMRSIRSAAGGHGAEITALAVSSHGEGVIPLNSGGNPLGSEIVSFDMRSIPETALLEKTFGAPYFFQQGGQLLASTGTMTKIMWMEHHPSLFSEKPSAYVCAGDFIAYRLTGKRVIDYSLAARTMMLDIHQKQWNRELLAFAGITPGQLSCPVQGGTGIGTLKADTAAQLGLRETTLVVSGGHDQPCALLGTGAVKAGGAVYSLGTTETLVCSTGHFTEQLYAYGLPCYPHVLPAQYVTLPGNFTGGNLLQWYKENFAGQAQAQAETEQRSVYDILMEEMAEEPTDILVLPHFTTTGSPWNDSESRGMICGLKLSTTKGEYIRALQEGVTYEIRLNLSLLEQAGMRPRHLIAVGGSTKSHKLMQLKADLLGIPIGIPDEMEAACRGAAFLAGIGSGILREDSVHWGLSAGNQKIIQPNLEKYRLYSKNFVKYKRMYSAQKEIYNNQK